MSAYYRPKEGEYIYETKKKDEYFTQIFVFLDGFTNLAVVTDCTDRKLSINPFAFPTLKQCENLRFA